MLLSTVKPYCQEAFFDREEHFLYYYFAIKGLSSSGKFKHQTSRHKQKTFAEEQSDQRKKW